MIADMMAVAMVRQAKTKFASNILKSLWPSRRGMNLEDVYGDRAGSEMHL